VAGLRRNWLVLAVGLIILLSFTKKETRSWASMSRLAAAWAISEHYGLAVDTPDNRFGRMGGDKALIRGRFYSDKPPVMGFLAGLAALGLKPFGLGFNRDRFATLYVLILLMVGLPFLAFIHLLSLRAGSQALGLAALLSSLALPYAFVFNNHLPAGCLLGLVLLRRLDETAGPRAALADGLMLGLAPALDFSAGLAGLPLALWVFFFRLKDSRSRLVLIGAGLIPLALHAGLNYPLTGDLKPPLMHAELLLFPGSALKAGDLTGVRGVLVEGLAGWLGNLWDLTLGVKGFLLLCPMSALGLAGLVAVILGLGARADRASFWTGLGQGREARLLAGGLLAGVLAVGLYYSLYASAHSSGWNYSIRWFVVLIPLVLPYALLLMARARGAWRPILWGLAAVSAVMALAAWPNPWLRPHQEVSDLIAGFRNWREIF